MTATEGVFRRADVRLQDGGVLPEVKIAYVTQGRLAPDGRNAILLTHGFTSSQHFAVGGAGASEGSWGALVGPGKPVDTDRMFVVSSNMLGSSFGSTGPASIDPRTGRPYGPDFPDITVSDIVAQQRALVEHLGVKHLHAVVGPSYGGFQAFQWAVDHPGFMDRVAPVVTSVHASADLGSVDRMVETFAANPAWNGGHHYGDPRMAETMTDLRVRTLKGYGLEADLAPRFPDPAAREAEIRRIAAEWGKVFDPNSLIALRKASLRYDVRPKLNRIAARVLFVLSRTDALFPPSLRDPTMAALKEAGVAAEYFEIDSDRGHLASGLDAEKWAPVLRAFLA
ncbi:MAG: alpha/beta fold hydrolase [Proteobacteria bacterium]|nr:alpha/beta fold hydrolase [Pseudomonadota bacterium]